MRTLSLALALGLMAPVSAQAQGAPPEYKLNLPGFALDTRSFVFPSGLQVLVQQDETAPMVAVATVIQAGSVEDAPGKAGSAQLSEVLWFQSRHDDGPRVQDRLYELGTVHNAETNPDYTSYYTAGPVESLRGILALESARLSEPLAGIGDPQLTAARELVRYRDLLGGGDPVDSAIPHVLPRLFPEDSGYGQVGPPGEELDGIQLADLEEFTERTYRPEHTTLMVVGDVHPQKVLDALFWTFEPSLFAEGLTEDDFEKYLAIDYDGDPGAADPENPDHMSMRPKDPDNPDEIMDLDRPRPVRIEGEGLPPEEPPGFRKDAILAEAAVEHPTAVVAWAIPGAYRGQGYLHNIVAGTLTGLIRSFYAEIPGLVKDPVTDQVAAECRVEPLTEGSVLACYMEMLPRSVADNIADKALDQVVDLWNPDMQYGLEQIYRNGRYNALARDLHALDDFSDPEDGRAIRTARFAHFSGELDLAAKAMGAIMETEGQDVSTFALDWLDRKRAIKLSLSPSAAAAGLAALGESAGYAGDMLSSTLVSEPDPEEIRPEAIAAAYHPPDLSEAVDFQLDNGLRVVLLAHGQAPVVSATLVALGGRNTGEVGMDDLVQHAHRAVPHGSFYDVQRDPLAVLGRWSFDRDAVASLSTLKAASGNLDQVLYSMRERVDSFTPALEYRRNFLNLTAEEINSDWQDPVYWADRQQWDRLAPGYSLFARPDHVRLDELKKVKSSEVRDYLHGKYHPENSVLVVVGDLDPDEARERVEARFGDWKGKSASPPPAIGEAPAPSTEGGVFLLDEHDDPQTTVDLSCRLPDHDQGHAAAQVVASTLFSEALHDELVGGDVILYTAMANAQQYDGGLALMQLYAVVNNAAVGSTIEAMRGMVDSLQAGEIEPAELGASKLHVARGSALRYQTLDQMADTVVDLVVDPDRTLDYYDQLGEELAGLEVADVAAALGSCADHAVVTVRGNGEAAAASLDSAGIAYETVDWQAMGDALLKEQDPGAYKKLLKERSQ